jgi:hypothetical protein
MRQIRISKRQRPARSWLKPLPPDARDPDIARAKHLARRTRGPQQPQQLIRRTARCPHACGRAPGQAGAIDKGDSIG